MSMIKVTAPPSTSPERVPIISLQRSQSHGGVDTFAVFYGRNGTAITHMASDDAFAGRIYAKVFADTLGYITVGRAMEAVTADAVFFIHLVGRAYI